MLLSNLYVDHLIDLLRSIQVLVTSYFKSIYGIDIPYLGI